MSDPIDRQAAIDALGDEPEVWTGKDEYAQGLNNQWHYDRNAIKAVPSAQSDLIAKIQNGIKATDADDVYSCGMRNGMRWCKSLIDGKEPLYENCPSAQPEKVCIANITLSEEQIREAVEKAKEELKNSPILMEPEPQWIPCSEHPDTDRNVFIARGKTDFLSCCIGHYDHNAKLWYEDRNWFAKIMYDAMYWCEMPPLPEPWKGEDNAN